MDIYTEKDHLVWEKTALYFGFHGAHDTGAELKSAFRALLEEQKPDPALLPEKGEHHYEFEGDDRRILAPLIQNSPCAKNPHISGEMCGVPFR